MTKVVIDPITRIEGHLRITCQVENGKVTDAWNTATMFRGFEIFMKGRDPQERLAVRPAYLRRLPDTARFQFGARRREGAGPWTWCPTAPGWCAT